MRKFDLLIESNATMARRIIVGRKAGTSVQVARMSQFELSGGFRK